MNTPSKLAAFALAAALVFTGAYGIGQAVGPVGTAPAGMHGDMQPGHGG